MKLFHLSDLHIGKRVNEVSMIPDQAHILAQILDMMDEEKPDALLIAGDVYDKSVPSAEAVTLFDDFLCRLAQRNMPVLIISGNHDSPYTGLLGLMVQIAHQTTAIVVVCRNQYREHIFPVRVAKLRKKS